MHDHVLWIAACANLYQFHAICAALWTSSFNSLLNVLFHPMLLDWLVGQMVLLVVSIWASHFYSIQNVWISIHGRECEGSAYTTYPCLQLPTYFFSSLALVILTRVSRLAVFAGNTLPCMVETLNCRWKFAIIYCYDPIIMWWCVNYLLEVWNTSQLHSFWWTWLLVEMWVWPCWWSCCLVCT